MVIRSKITPETSTIEDWNVIFEEFIEEISSEARKEIAETLETSREQLANLSIMCAMKEHFTYEVIMCVRHFPFIVIEGTVEDWQKIVEKLEKIRKFHLDF